MDVDLLLGQRADPYGEQGQVFQNNRNSQLPHMSCLQLLLSNWCFSQLWNLAVTPVWYIHAYCTIIVDKPQIGNTCTKINLIVVSMYKSNTRLVIVVSRWKLIVIQDRNNDLDWLIITRYFDISYCNWLMFITRFDISCHRQVGLDSCVHLTVLNVTIDQINVLIFWRVFGQSVIGRWEKDTGIYRVVCTWQWRWWGDF